MNMLPLLMFLLSSYAATLAGAFSSPLRLTGLIFPFSVSDHRISPLLNGRRRIAAVQCKSGDGLEKGFNVMEWTGAIIPQGVLVKGVKTGWRLAWSALMKELAPQSKDGEYIRPSYDFKGEIGTHTFPECDEPGRFHLYAGKACPWCHRVELVRSVRRLQECISMTTVLDRPEEASRGGWVFTSSSPDPVVGAKDLREVYDVLTGGFRGRCTAPLLVVRVVFACDGDELKHVAALTKPIT